MRRPLWIPTEAKAEEKMAAERAPERAARAGDDATTCTGDYGMARTGDYRMAPTGDYRTAHIGDDGTAADDRRAPARLPVAVIGAGPVGLVAAAHLVARGEVPVVFEAGAAVGWNIREWAHVRLFSPWKYLTDPVSRTLLERAGWTSPDPDALPTGGELVERFLEPLAELPEIAPCVRLERRVVAVARRGLDKMKTPGRDGAPFELVARARDGAEERVLARAVIDASGTWTAPNPIGANGLAVPGEHELAARIRYGIPDVLGRERARYAGRRVLVVGSGHSAFNVLLDLAELRARAHAGAADLVWAVRRADVRQLYGGGERDQLEARGALGERLRRLVEDGEVRCEAGFRAVRVERAGDGVVVYDEGGRAIGPVDEIVVATGFRPDLSITRELRLRLDDALECPVALAPLIDPNLHSCGTVSPHGFRELSHPERDFYTVGMKSYGRAPTFLLLTGYEQVRSVVCALTGDLEGARNVELVLPETGVCATDLGGSACCDAGAAPRLVGLGAAASGAVHGDAGGGACCA
ncbi:MAG TPA: NAD(P)-binding domain-containing protein [Longimicrobiales bacterium]